MRYEKYEPLFISTDALEFKFLSIGPKGAITIVVQFRQTDNTEIYNLAFGNLLADGTVDDQIKNGNWDRDKILATVARTVYEFTSRYPGKMIIFSGSTASRTRLYRMALANNLEELSVDFEVFGITLDSGQFLLEGFLKGVDYYGFMVKRK